MHRAISIIFFTIVLASALVAETESYKTVSIGAGRQLSYQEFGDRWGTPVVYFHGLNGSHLEASAIHKEAAASHIRLISVDRPGIGASTYVHDRSILDWVDDFEKFTHALNLGNQKLGIFAVSGGCPYACAVAANLPHRVSRLNLVSPFAPIDSLDGQKSIVKNQIMIAKKYPKLAVQIFNQRKRNLDSNPHKVLKNTTKNWYSKDKDLVNMYIDEQICNFKHVVLQGGCGVVKDISLHLSDWESIVSTIPSWVNIKIWAGAADPVAPSNMAAFYRNRIQGSSLYTAQDEGHLSIIKNYAATIFAEYH